MSADEQTYLNNNPATPGLLNSRNSSMHATTRKFNSTKNWRNWRNRSMKIPTHDYLSSPSSTVPANQKTNKSSSINSSPKYIAPVGKSSALKPAPTVTKNASVPHTPLRILLLLHPTRLRNRQQPLRWPPQTLHLHYLQVQRRRRVTWLTSIFNQLSTFHTATHPTSSHPLHTHTRSPHIKMKAKLFKW